MRKSLVLIFIAFLYISTATHAQPVVTEATYIRFAHFSADASLVDIQQAEEVISAQLAFGDITPWQRIEPDSIAFRAVSAASEPQFHIDPLTVDLLPGSRITLVLIGSAAQQTLRLQPVIDPTDELQIGEARLSIFYAIENGPAVDVFLNDDALFQLVRFPADIPAEEAADGDTATSDGFVTEDIVGTTYTLQITEHADREAVLVALGELRLMPMNAYFIAVIGTPDRPQLASAVTDLQASSLEDPASAPPESAQSRTRLRAAHLSSGTPAIDIYINGERAAFSGLGFGDLSGFEDFTPGTYEIAIGPAGATIAEASIGPVMVEIAAGEWKTIALIGTLTTGTIQVQVLNEDFRPLAEGNSRITLYHANGLVGPVNVRLADGTPLLQLLAYPGSQQDNDGLSTFELPTGDYTLEIIPAREDEPPLVTLTDFRLLPGRHYFLALVIAEPPYVIAVEGF